MRKILLVVLFSFVLILSSCSVKDYVNHMFKGKDKVTNSIVFVQDEYIVSKGKETKVYVKAELDDYQYADDIVYSLDDSSFGSVTENGVIIPSESFVEGETTIRARIEKLKIEAFANVYFTESSIVVLDTEINYNRTNKMVIDTSNLFQLISNSSFDYADFEINFESEYVLAEAVEDGYNVKCEALGTFNYFVKFKNSNRVVYRGQIHSSLNSEAIENRARELLEKNYDDVVTKAEMASISDLDDGSCFINKGITTMDDFKYFPLITSLNVSNNQISEIDLNFENLTYFNASHNAVNNVIYPNFQSKLEWLDISFNSCDLSLFDDNNLPKLKVLYANNNICTNGSFSMRGNDDFYYLNISDSSITAVNVEKREALKYFLAALNNISDLSGISGANLMVLDVVNNSISSLSILSENTNLCELYIGGNPISTAELINISRDVRSNIFRLNLSITGSIDYDAFKQFIFDCSPSLKWLQIYNVGLTDI